MKRRLFLKLTKSDSTQMFQLSNHCFKEIHARSVFAYVNHDHRSKEKKPIFNLGTTTAKLSNSKPLIDNTVRSTRPSNSLFFFGTRVVPFLSSSSLPRLYSSSSSSGSNPKTMASSSASEANIPNGSEGTEWLGKAKDLWNGVVEATAYTGQRAKEASDELSPHFERLMDSYPYLKDVVGPVSLTLTGTLLAWFVMPRILRRFHRYTSQGQAAFLPANMVGEVPYEKSFWAALEDPVRYLVTFMAFTQIGMMVAPTSIASEYLTPAWRGAVIISFMWFLHRWKTSVFGRALAASSGTNLEREKLIALDKISTVGLMIIGIMGLAEACGVAVQSIVTVGGIGGVATAFAARDILGNVLSGLSMQFSRPFSVGDTIKAGSVEGQVVEMGLTSTLLLSAEKFPVVVPNSLFSSQVIVNKSRAEWRSTVNKIPLQINDLDKIPEITNDVNNMLKSHANVFLGKEPPYCFLSRIDGSFAELTIGCNLKRMKKEDLYTTEQDIILQSVQIIKHHGAKLGSVPSG